MQTPGSLTWWPNPLVALATVEYNRLIAVPVAVAVDAIVALDLAVEKVAVAVAAAELENGSVAAGNVVAAAFAFGPAAGTLLETGVAAFPEDDHATTVVPSQVLDC